MVIWLKIFKTEKTIEIQLVRLTELCGKVISEKNAYKSVKTASLLVNGIDADHQNSCFLPYINRCWSLRGPCAKGQGDLVGKTFQNCLNITDD